MLSLQNCQSQFNNRQMKHIGSFEPIPLIQA